MGKCLNSLVIATVLSWLVCNLFYHRNAGIYSFPVTGLILTPGWLNRLIPGRMAMVPIAISVYVSSRVNDPRAAQQAFLKPGPCGAPVFLILGMAVATPWLALLAAVGFGLLGAGSLYLATRLFRREVILTRWS